MSSTGPAVDVNVAKLSEDAKQREKNEEVSKCIVMAFLEFRKVITDLTPSECGLLDDMSLTWISRYQESDAKRDPKEEEKKLELKKLGRLYMTTHTKTRPDGDGGSQKFHSFIFDTNVTFENDMHPKDVAAAKEATVATKKGGEDATAQDDGGEYANLGKLSDIVSAAILEEQKNARLP
jgi:hypothetical protein